ncbi:hypothetical protein NQD34_009984 [Periophthalmus magnuspinnatus]|nr:hypothetical protein NQD34_009984 [Periophthalmus magnuspinnatus]
MTGKIGEIPPPLPSQTPGQRSVVGRCRHHLFRLRVLTKPPPFFKKPVHTLPTFARRLWLTPARTHPAGAASLSDNTPSTFLLYPLPHQRPITVTPAPLTAPLPRPGFDGRAAGADA